MNSNERGQADACSITAIQRIDEPSRQRRDRMEVVIMSTHTQHKRAFHRAWPVLGLVLAMATPLPLTAAFDICGCEGHPDSLGDFDNRTDPATWPVGITRDGCQDIRIALPPDGVVIFDSFYVEDNNNVCETIQHIYFTKNANNTPVTMLVAGNVSLVPGSSGTNVELIVSGSPGSNGSPTKAGIGGAPGNGGFRGGDGASRDLLAASMGGPGLGPGGGEPGVDTLVGGDARYKGRPELRPLIGASGGGGGGSAASGNCSGGGGGGGGGSIIIAANGTLHLGSTNVYIRANGGNRGGSTNGACASSGGLGAGGAIRLMSDTFSGDGRVTALRGDGANVNALNGGGIIRIETITDVHTRSDLIQPAGLRTSSIGPVVNPVASTIAITAVDGTPTPTILTGSIGGIDMIVPAPGLITFQIETAGVPSGTTVDVAAKPKFGGVAFTDNVNLEPGSCNTAGECTVFSTIDLPSNAYFVESTATFQTP